jgi:hypothetical protein
MILLVWLLSRKRRSWQIAARGLAAISAALAVAQVTAAQLHHADQLDLPAGRVAIEDPRTAEVYRWMARQTHPGQWYFGMPPYMLPLALKNPTPIEAPAPGEYSRPEQIATVLEGLERTQTKLLLLRPAMYIPHLLEYKRTTCNRSTTTSSVTIAERDSSQPEMKFGSESTRRDQLCSATLLSVDFGHNSLRRRSKAPNGPAQLPDRAYPGTFATGLFDTRRIASSSTRALVDDIKDPL